MDKLEPIRAVFRQACLYNHAADDLLCQRLAEAMAPKPSVPFHKAEAAAREAARRAKEAPSIHTANRCHHALDDLLAALDAARGEAVLWRYTHADGYSSFQFGEPTAAVRKRHKNWQPLYLAPQAPPAQPVAVDADNVTPLRQPRADLARLVESINAAVYDNAKGLSVTEAIGALELAKLELLKEQEQ